MATVTFTISADTEPTKTNKGNNSYTLDVTPADNAVRVGRVAGSVGEVPLVGGSLLPKTGNTPSRITLLVGGGQTIPEGTYEYDTEKETFNRLATTTTTTTQDLYDILKYYVLTALTSLQTSLDEADSARVSLGEFETNGTARVEFDDDVTRFEGIPATKNEFKNFKINDYAVTATGRSGRGPEDTITVIKGEWNRDVAETRTPDIDGIPQILTQLAEEDALFRELLQMGSTGKEALDDETAAALYRVLKDFIEAFDGSINFNVIAAGVADDVPADDSFGTYNMYTEIVAATEDRTSAVVGAIKAAQEAAAAAAAEAASEPESAATATSTTAVGGNAPTDSTASAAKDKSSASSSAPTTPTTVTDGGEAPNRKEESRDTILFRYVIFGADAEQDARMRIVLNDGNAYDYAIPGERIGSFQSFIVNGSNRDGFKNNLRTYARVTITAQPASGGDPVKQTNDIYIPQSLTDDIVYHFRFSPSRSWTKNTGEAVGNRSAGRVSNPQGDVYCVYWTVSGGVAEGMVDAQIRVSGKTYTVTFAGEPLLVPIELDINLERLSEGRLPIAARKKILNEAVPHWIFLRPAAGGAGAGGGGGRDGEGGRGGRGDGAGDAGGKQRMKVNIAVSELTFTTTQKWVTIPNTGNVVTLENFSFKAAESLAGKQLPDSAKGVTLALDGLKTQGYNANSVTDEVFRVLFENSEAWRRVGGDQLNCWIKDQTVVGTYSSLTTREGYRYV